MIDDYVKATRSMHRAVENCPSCGGYAYYSGMAWDTGISVSKSHPTIKKIIDSTNWLLGAQRWGGRIVKVVRTGDTWQYLLYNDSGEPYVFVMSGEGKGAARASPPSYGAREGTSIPRPENGSIVVTRQIGPTGTITIYVPPFDETQMEIARDAMMSGGKVNKAHLQALLKPFGEYAGLAHAVLEAQINLLNKASSRGESTQAKNRRLDREIDQFLKTRTRS